MRLFIKSICCAVVLAFAALPVQAAETKAYRLDPAHTRVMFFVDHLGLSKFPGQFTNVNGTIQFNFANNEASEVDVVIDARHVSMGHAALDAKLQGKEYFNTAQFPDIRFKSTRIHRQSVAHGRITGDLTFLGVTRPVTLDVTYNGRKWNRFGRAEFAGFSAKTSIRRSDFGMKTMLPDVGDVVELRIEVEAREVRPAFAQ